MTINGNGWKTWALGIAVSLAGATLAWGWSANSSRIDATQASVNAVNSNLQSLAISRGERIAKAEAEISTLRLQLERIEHKLDIILLERRK